MTTSAYPHESGTYYASAESFGCSLRAYQNYARGEREIPKSIIRALSISVHTQLMIQDENKVTQPADDFPHVRLTRLRKELGLNQINFANSIGLTQSGLSSIERGEVPLRLAVALAIEAVYRVRHQWLLYGKLPQKIKTNGRGGTKHLMPDEQRFLDLFHAADKGRQRLVVKLLKLLSEK